MRQIFQELHHFLGFPLHGPINQRNPVLKGGSNINGNTIHVFVCIFDTLSSYNLLCNGTYSRDMKNTICLSVYVLLLHFKHA